MHMKHVYKLGLLLVLSVMLSACGFNLRDSQPLPETMQQVGLKGIDGDRNFGSVLKIAFIDARSQLLENGALPVQLSISDLEEERRVLSYDSDLEVRQYLLTMKFSYSFEVNGKQHGPYLMSLDNTLNYDADYVLGKQEEQRKIRKALREDAARLILLRLKSIPL